MIAMNQKALHTTLLISALLSILGVFLKFSVSNAFGSILCFPLAQIGMGLRWLSLQGGLQNVIAFIFYIALCVVPLFVRWLLKKKKKDEAADEFLVVLSLLLFYVIYMMINPGLIPMPTAAGIENSMAQILLCGTVYSVLVAYLVLRWVNVFFNSKTEKLHRYMVALLWFAAILLTISIFGVGLNDACLEMKSIKLSNTGSEDGLGITYFFTGLRFLIDSIPNFVSILVIFSGLKFIRVFSTDQYSVETIGESEKLSQICKIGLTLTMSSNVVFNIVQLFFMPLLRNIKSSIEVPLFSIIFVLGTLIFSKMVISNKTLKDDNDSII
ncbi:hypothetical protein DSECCO2_174180 [anaerobic digester metagenome]